ncbi:MAG: hypothetical protein PUB19_00900 [Lachnospiraceae bacterium]|nr:hypothetical protein [Lachnospiraceae bacterium]
MNLETRRELDYLRRDLHEIEKEEQELRLQLERVMARKQQLLDTMTENSDEEYEQEALSRLYEQKKSGK